MILEENINFGEVTHLSGIMTIPNAGIDSGKCIILLNAGMIQKMGPYRLYVNLARYMAMESYYSFRFDFSGIGDSSNSYDNLTHKDRLIKEIQLAINEINKYAKFEEIILLGMCSGADAAFRYLMDNNNIVSKYILINGYYIDDSQIADINDVILHSVNKRYYTKKMFSREALCRVFKFNLTFFKKMRSIMLKKCPNENNNLPRTTSDFKKIGSGNSILLIFSEGSTSYDVFNYLHKYYVIDKPWIKSVFFENVDHTFTPVKSQSALIRVIKNWLLNRS